MRKMLILLLAVFMLAATACSSGGGSKSDSNAAQQSNDGGKAAQSDEPVTITIADKDFPQDDPNTQKLIKGIEEGMKAEGKNIKLEIVPVQSGTYSEKLGLLLQSGNIPDLIYFQGGDYQFAVTQQILEDLTPYIEKSQYLKATLSDYNLERMKNYPYLVWPAPTTTSVPVVRKDWFDKTESGKALLDNPSIDNYYNFLKEVKEKNGAQFAYTVAGSLAELDTVFDEAFGLTTTWIKGDDGKYTFGRTTSFEKDKLDFYAKLYKDGLLDPEFLTKKWDTKEKAFYDGQAAVIAGRQGDVVNIYYNKMVAQNGANAAIMPLPPAKGKGQGYTPIDVSKESRGFAISATSKHKDLAFAVLDFMASPQGQMLDHLGVEGDEYTIVDNKIHLTDKYAAWYAHFINSTISFKPDKEFDPATPLMWPPAVQSLDMVAKMSNKDNAFIIPADLATKWDACNALYTEFAANYVTGKKTAADFDAFVKAWNDAGGKDITDYANKTIK